MKELRERRLHQLLSRVARASVPLSTMALLVACGGSSSSPPDTGPCAPFPNQPGCGGGVNYCVAPHGIPTAALEDGGAGAVCTPFCTSGGVECGLVEVNGQQLVRCSSPCTGRRPAGLVAQAPPSGSEIATYLEEAAYLEAASVDAFSTLEEELVHHGAPRSLVRAAARAAKDEVRHARMMRRLARRHDAVCRRPQVTRRRIRGLLEMAVENAVEGCVRETFGAALAVRQSLVAGDESMRSAMKSIARDETRHARLAWRVGAWLERKLTGEERRHVAEARGAAVAQLACELAGGTSPSMAHFAGLPAAVDALQMLAQMREALWRSDETPRENAPRGG